MLSYQHSYHAGCLADIHKHSILAAILSKLIEKNKPLSYFETHSGRGLYNLDSEESLKTGEAEEGILSVWGHFSDYLNLSDSFKAVINKIRQDYGPFFYPGSPLFAKEILRDSDKLYLMELHPQEYEALKANMLGKNIQTHMRNGYQGTLALSPPPIRRGVIFIDPSYEVKNEYQDIATFIKKIHRKWSVATILLWYPILKQNYHVEMVQQIKDLSPPKLWIHEHFFPKSHAQNALGSGMLAINMPYGVEVKEPLF